ncbi:hypothetical protein P3L10_030077 [Capsicum annuum]
MNSQSNTTAEEISSQRNVSGLADSSFKQWSNPYFSDFFRVSTYYLYFINVLAVYWLKPSSKCSISITLSFKSEVDSNGINWKGVSEDVIDGYFGEFKKDFYWDASISEDVESNDCIKTSKINSKNHCGGREVAAGTHTGGFNIDGEHWKKLVSIGYY